MSLIQIPEELTPLEAINFAKYVANCTAEKEFIYDFSDMQHCHPFGMLLVGNAIRNNRRKYRKAIHRQVGEDITQGSLYAADLGFFQYAGWDVGRKTDSFDYGVRHIPIKKISVKELQSVNQDTTVLGEMIDRHAQDLSYTLTQSTDSEATKTLQYCLREMIRNTFEHGNTEEVWVCGQFWPGRNEAEIALLDEGCGIFNSLSRNRHYRLSTHADANKLALQPGVSRMLGVKQDPYDPWQNSGYGLFMASALCALGGYFILCSGNDATLVNSQYPQSNYLTNMRGTAICMNIHTDQISNLQDQLDKLTRIGAQKARENADQRILSASKVSTIASLVGKSNSQK